MRLGSFIIEQLSEGFFEFHEDGSFSKTDAGSLNQPEPESFPEKSSVALGIDPLFIQTHSANIIIDPGLGWGLDKQSAHMNTSNAVTNLDVFDIRPDQIDWVILTHLHYDHSAGSTYVSDDLTTQPVFPNARYLVHQSEWDYALTHIDKKRTGKQFSESNYYPDELYRLVADGRFYFMNSDHFSPVEGIEAFKTGGHTPGHLAVKITDDEKQAYYPGDLVPTEYHLNHYPLKQIDIDPVQSKKQKTRILREALKNDAYLFFYHSLYQKSGRLSLDMNKQYKLISDKESEFRGFGF